MKRKLGFDRRVSPTTWTLVLVLGLSAIGHAKAKPTPPVESELKPVKGDLAETETRALKAELLVAKTESQALSQLNKLLKKYRGTALEPGLLLRKAELFARMSKTERFFEISRDSETVVRLAPQKVKSASSRRYLEQAAQTYDGIQKSFPRYSEMDVVLFNNAFVRQQLGQDKFAENLYRDLEQRFPSSALIPDTHLALGEMLFERRNFQDAHAQFEKIRKYPESRVYPYGLYKSAWAKYNLKDGEGALKNLEEVVAFGAKVEEAGLDAKLDLRQEAWTDMVLFFAEVGNPTNAISYFRKQTGNEFGTYVLRLSALYLRHSKYKDHDSVLGQFVKSHDDRPEVPKAYESLVGSAESQRNREAALNWLIQFQKACETDQCRDVLSRVSLEMASKWNRMWRKNPTFDIFADSSLRGYEIYLSSERDLQKTTEPRFAYAEILFKRERWMPASQQYAMVSRDSKDDKVSHDAAYAAIVSLDKAVGEKWDDKSEKTFVELTDFYFKRHSKGPHYLDLRFKRALIAYERSRYDEAAPILRELSFKSFNFTEKAQTLYLDTLNIKKDYKTLEQACADILKQKLSPARATEIRKVQEQATFAQAQALREVGDREQASAGFERFYRNFKSSDLADKALWNSILIFSEMGEIAKATNLSQELVQSYPKSPHRKDAALKAAQGYEAMLDLPRAADAVLRYAEFVPEENLKWQAVAGDFFAIAGQSEKARQIYGRLVQSKDPAVKQAAYMKLLAISQQKGKEDFRLLTEIAGSGLQPQAGLANARLSELHFEEKRFEEAFRLASRTLEMKKSEGGSAHARARLVQAKILHQELRSQNIKSRAERLQLVLQIKTEKLEKAQSAYQDTVRYGDGRTSVRALLGLASALGEYVDSLRNIELVGSTTQEELLALRKELESISAPLEDRRLDVLKDALKLARKLELRDSSVAEIQIQINQVNLSKRGPSSAAVILAPAAYLPKEGSLQ